jgi:hypothetical protein
MDILCRLFRRGGQATYLQCPELAPVEPKEITKCQLPVFHLRTISKTANLVSRNFSFPTVEAFFPGLPDKRCYPVGPVAVEKHVDVCLECLGWRYPGAFAWFLSKGGAPMPPHGSWRSSLSFPFP